MSFLGGPECSTGANPLAQFQKQTSADTSLQRDRLASRQPQQFSGFRSGQQISEDASFQEFAQQGPQMGEMLPNDGFRFEQYRQELEHLQRAGGGGAAAGGANWAGEFAQKGPQFSPEEFAQQRGVAFSPQDFAQFRQSQLTPTGRTASPNNTYQSAFRPPTMMGGSMYGGMQRPMMYGNQMWNQPPQQQQYEGKGKGRVQELSDTDWEKQFADLSTEDKEADLEQLDREANEAIERELNHADR